VAGVPAELEEGPVAGVPVAGVLVAGEVEQEAPVMGVLAVVTMPTVD
jgi:hypothetical protein